jgi:HlyD family secretion protein
MMRSLTSRILLAIGVVLVAVGLVFLLRGGSKKTEYLTAPVERGDISVTVSANGTLNPVTLVNVGTQVSGTVRKLSVDYNSSVVRDQVLAELDDRTYLAAVHQSEANVANAAAQVELAAANHKRSDDLYAKGYSARQDLDQTVQAEKSARAQWALAKAQLDRDRTNLSYSVIRSPVSGVVVSREVDVGQTVAASFQTPTLFKIAQDLSKMQIDSSFAEADVGRVRVDQTVRFTVDAFPDRDFAGVVKQVRLNPTTVQNVVTYDVVVSVENPEQRLLPGMTAYVNVLLSQRPNVLKVPNAALRFRPPGVDLAVDAAPKTPVKGQGPPGAPTTAGADARQAHGGSRRVSGPRAIYVLRAGAPVAVQVVLGGTDRRYTEVVSGDLKEGDLVVTAVAGAAAGAGTQPPGSAPRVRMF